MLLLVYTLREILYIWGERKERWMMMCTGRLYTRTMYLCTPELRNRSYAQETIVSLHYLRLSNVLLRVFHRTNVSAVWKKIVSWYRKSNLLVPRYMLWFFARKKINSLDRVDTLSVCFSPLRLRDSNLESITLSAFSSVLYGRAMPGRVTRRRKRRRRRWGGFELYSGVLLR